MVLCDVCVLLHALFRQASEHERCRAALNRLINEAESFAIADQILAAVVRIGTNSRVYQPPGNMSEVFGYVNMLRDHPRAVRVAPARRHWTIFQDLVTATGVTGATTSDAWLAALAIEHGCEWWTTDRDFARFPGLMYRNLLD